MQFAHPEMFWLLIPAVLFVAGFLAGLKRRKRSLMSFAGIENMKKLTGSFSYDRKVFKFLFLLVSLVFLILASAGPQWGKELQEISRKGIDVVVALDVSKSMLAQDIQPSRLDKAKREIEGFLDKLEGDRVGLVYFAGSSFIQCPLTLDYGAVRMFLDLADPNANPFPGTDIAGAIENSIKVFETSGKRSKVVILMTDGETHTSNTEEAVKNAADKGIIIYTVGYGGGAGVPIPLRDEKGFVIGYKRDEDGNPVLSSLNQQLLSEIADKTGGEYFASSTEEGELEKIADRIDSMEKTKFTSRKGTKYKDRYQYPLTVVFFALIAYLLINDRKKGY
jgi:Ca-activated chloride channel family protein